MRRETAEVVLEETVFTVSCECGRQFRAEDVEPECPYCERKYSVEVETIAGEVKVKISHV